MKIESFCADRDATVMKYAYLCRRAARKFIRPGLDRQDLCQIGMVGLLKAYDRYDAALATPFEAFAWLFIIGELMHYVRDYERMVRPPRKLRALDKRAQAAFEELGCELGREPRRSDIAGRLGLSTREIDELYACRERAIAEPIDKLDSCETKSTIYTMDCSEDRLSIDAALNELTPTERTIILGVYGSGFSQLEIAARLGYSRRHVSRLHRAALKKMRPVLASVA